MTDESRPLDPVERVAFIRFALVAQGVSAQLDAQLIANSAMTHFEYQILNFLNGSPERSLPMTRLAELTASSLSRLSHAVAHLEKGGRVTRSRSAEDGRVTIATLTDEGRRVYREAVPGHVANIRRLIFDRLDAAEVAQLDSVMGKLVPGIDPQGTLGDLAR